MILITSYKRGPYPWRFSFRPPRKTTMATGLESVEDGYRNFVYLKDRFQDYDKIFIKVKGL